MIGYVTIGTNHFEEAASFFDKLFATLGAARYIESDRLISWSAGKGNPAIAIAKPFDGEKATCGNGCMVAIPLESTDQVDAFYAKAIELGGTDEGEPGQRNDVFYCAYFRDLDGNKFNAFCMTPKGSGK